jgi:hypothetical protein
MIGNNSLDGIIRLDQQNPIIPLRNAHFPNWPRTWLTVNRKFFCQLIFYNFHNHSHLSPVVRRNAGPFLKSARFDRSKKSWVDGQPVLFALGIVYSAEDTALRWVGLRFWRDHSPVDCDPDWSSNPANRSPRYRTTIRTKHRAPQRDWLMRALGAQSG